MGSQNLTPRADQHTAMEYALEQQRAGSAWRRCLAVYLFALASGASLGGTGIGVASICTRPHTGFLWLPKACYFNWAHFVSRGRIIVTLSNHHTWLGSPLHNGAKSSNIRHRGGALASTAL